MLRHLFLATLLVLSTLLLSTVADPCQGPPPESACTFHSANFNCQSGDFVVEETGNQNVPRFTFYSSKSSSDQYTFRLSSLYEVDGNLKKSGPSSVSLSSVDWAFTTPAVVQTNVTENNQTNCHQETTFNITSPGGGKARWSSLTLVVHLAQSDALAVKYDFVLDGYTWWNTDSSYNLVVESNLSGSGKKNNDTGSNSTKDVLTYDNGQIRLGNAYFNGSSQAQLYPSNASVAVNISLGQNSILTRYDHFQGGQLLIDDPEVGIASNKSGSSAWVWIVVAVAIVAVVAVVVVGFIAFRYVRSRNQYASL